MVDNELVFNDVEYILNQPAGLAESIEILKSNDIRCVRYNAQAGVVLIKTRQGFERPVVEQTAKDTVEPLGLASLPSRQQTNLLAPSMPGRYLLLVDIITKDKQVCSFCREFEVKERL